MEIQTPRSGMPSARDIQRANTSKSPWGSSEKPLPPDARIRKVRRFISTLPPASRILDLGCADGSILAPFVNRLRVSGVDEDERLVALAKSRGIDAVQGSVDNLPFEANSFDALFAGEVIEHTISPDYFLCEANRILEMGGRMFLTVPNIRTPIGMAMLCFGLPPMFSARYRSAHFRDFTARVIKNALRNNGFKIERFTGSAFMLPFLGPRMQWLAGRFPSWADHFIIETVKVADAHYDSTNEFSSTTAGS